MHPLWAGFFYLLAFVENSFKFEIYDLGEHPTHDFLIQIKTIMFSNNPDQLSWKLWFTLMGAIEKTFHKTVKFDLFGVKKVIFFFAHQSFVKNTLFSN